MQVIWIIYAVFYIALSHVLDDTEPYFKYFSFFALTIGATIINAMIYHGLLKQSLQEIIQTLFISCLSWLLLIEKTLTSETTQPAAVFCIVFLTLTGYLVWKMDKSKMMGVGYIVFLALLATTICSFVTLIGTRAINEIDIVKSKYYVIGHHGLESAAVLITCLWCGSKILPGTIEYEEGIGSKRTRAWICVALFVVLCVSVYLSNVDRMERRFGVNRELEFGVASVVYSLIYVMVLVGSAWRAIRLDVDRVGRSVAANLIKFSLVVSFPAALTLWILSPLYGRDLLYYWALEVYFLALLSVSFYISVSLGAKLVLYSEERSAAVGRSSKE